MRAARAERLATRADGPPTWRARRAWRILRRRGAFQVVWQRWLDDPRDDRWEWLHRRYSPGDVFAAAVDPSRDPGARAALGAFCGRHDLVPDDATEHALFLVLTGQHERYQALDPDGTLLAGAYHGALEATREVLRHTMIGAGELNLVRVLAEHPDKILTDDEARYLTGQLTGERLWRIIPSMPMSAAIEAARQLRDWRPSDAAGRAFLPRLAATDPMAIAVTDAAAMTRLGRVRATGFSIAPDNTEIAVARDRAVSLLALPGGRPIAEYPEADSDMLALGDGTVVGTRDRTLVCWTPDRPAEVLLSDLDDPHVDRTPDGYVVASGTTLWFGTAEDVVSQVTESPGDLVAVDHHRGQLLFRSADELVLTDADLRPLARTWANEIRRYRFCGPERIVGWSPYNGPIEVVRRDGTTLARTATKFLGIDRMPRPVPMPTHDRVAIPGWWDQTWYDADTLAPADRPAEFPVRLGQDLAFSPDGTLAAMQLMDGPHVIDLPLSRFAVLAAGPLARMTPADLATVRVAADRWLTPPVRETVELVLAGLAYRFGADVALGAGDPIGGGADDIAMGEPPGIA